jgi:adenylylsulfate kinase
MSGQVRVIIITGTMGSGKTTVLGEASDILSSAGIVHAAIDVDALGICNLPAGLSHELMFRNLEAVWSNYRAAGVTRVLLAEAIECRGDLNRIPAAIPDAEIIVCRLLASTETAEERVRNREPGMLQEKFVTRVAEVEKILDAAHLEDFSIPNDHTSVTKAAREMLTRAGWL